MTSRSSFLVTMREVKSSSLRYIDLCLTDCPFAEISGISLKYLSFISFSTFSPSSVIFLSLYLPKDINLFSTLSPFALFLCNSFIDFDLLDYVSECELFVAVFHTLFLSLWSTYSLSFSVPLFPKPLKQTHVYLMNYGFPLWQ